MQGSRIVSLNINTEDKAHSRSKSSAQNPANLAETWGSRGNTSENVTIDITHSADKHVLKMGQLR
jgi:hypothetical protein